MCAAAFAFAGERVAAGPKPIDETPERIAVLALDAAEAGELDRAHEFGLRLIAATPEAPMTIYKLACAFAEHDDKDRAVRWLTISAERGFRFEAKLLRDENLDPIREHPGFAKATEVVRANAATALETFKVRAAKEAKILIALPPAFDPARPAPLIVALHGYGGSAKGMIRVWKNVAAQFGAILIAPEALDPAGEGHSWTVSYESEHLVLRAIEEARKAQNIDPKKVVVTGFSQGAMLTFDVALTHPKLFAGAIPISGFYDSRVAAVPDKAGTKLPRFAILNGELDPEAEQNRATARLFEKIGSPVMVNIYKGVGHAFPPKIDQDLGAALKFVLE